MIQHQFSIQADAAATRYGVLVEAWRGIYAQSLDSSRFGTPANIAEVRVKAYEIGLSFLNTEAELVAAALAGITESALTDARASLSVDDAQETPEAVSEHENALGLYLRNEIAIQIERDIAFLQQSLTRTQLQVTIAARAQGIPARAALMSYRMSSVGELNFFFHDRRNQKWPSRRFIRALWRQNLMALYNEVVLMTLADHGEEFAMVSHANPDAEAHEMQIAMGANTAIPTYSDIRNEIFHPNSDAIVTRWLEED